MISKTKLTHRIEKKTNSSLVSTLTEAKKHAAWRAIAQRLSASTRRHASVNLSEIEQEAKEGDTVLVPGKVLSSGTLSKKVRVCALAFSGSSMEKIKSAKGEAVTIMDEIKNNKDAKGVRVLG